MAPTAVLAGDQKLEEDNEDDSDFKLSGEGCALGGDCDLYYNPLYSVHELYYVKTRLEGIIAHKMLEIAAKNMAYYRELEKSLTPDEKTKLATAMKKGEEYQNSIIADRAKNVTGP